MSAGSGEIDMVIPGNVGTDVELANVNGVCKATFRVANTPHWFDRTEQRWRDRETNWLTVECWRNLAENVFGSIHKGDPVVVRGVFRTSSWTDTEGARRSRTVVQASMVSHDLNRGVGRFERPESTGTAGRDGDGVGSAAHDPVGQPERAGVDLAVGG